MGGSRSIGPSNEPGNDDERAVTEVIAFILVFAVILGSVALLYTTGFQAMHDYQEHEQLGNAEHGLTSLGDNFNDVLRYDGVDRRYGELTLRGGTMRIGGENTTLTIGSGDPGGGEDFDLGSLQYEAGGDTIAYEGGGVFRASGDGSVEIKRPPMRCNAERDAAVVSILVLETDEERSIQSDDGVGFTITKSETLRAADLGEIDPTEDDLWIEIDDDSPYQNGWEQALERNGWDEDGDAYTCDATRIEVQIVTATIDY